MKITMLSNQCFYSIQLQGSTLEGVDDKVFASASQGSIGARLEFSCQAT
jgi:hypothetical protein